MMRPVTYEAYRQALRKLVDEAWPFHGLTQAYQSSVYQYDTRTFGEYRMTVAKNRRWIIFGGEGVVVDAFQDAWDYFQAERLLTADTKWCDAFARKLNNLKDGVR